jgi:hypothetical protein
MRQRSVGRHASCAEGFRSGLDQFLLAKTLLNFPPVKPDTRPRTPGPATQVRLLRNDPGTPAPTPPGE